MNTIEIDFEKISDYADFYTDLAQQLHLPGYFGRNLDALYDTLTGEVELPLEIRFSHLTSSKRRVFYSLIRLMEMLNEEMEEFFFVIEA